MHDADDLDGADEPMYGFTRSLRTTGPTVGLLIAILGAFAVDPASAQTTGEAFCETEMATTIRNMFSLIQFGGPLIGGVIALGTTIALTAIRTVDSKKELKSMRNQAVIWGVIVAPLGTAILQFLLTSVVAGGSSCSF